MKKIIPLFIIALVLISPILANEASATTVFLTSDDVLGQSEDFKMLNDIKDKIEEKSNGQITVIVDESASSPGEGTRAMEADCDIAVTVAYACAGNLVELGAYSSKVSKKIIFVNAGSLDLTDINFLRRAYDDNWSSSSFAALQSPGQFLYDAGVTLLQPGQKYYSETDNGNLDYSSSTINDYIADEVVKQVYTSKKNMQYDSDLIVRHKLDPKYLATDSKLIVDGYGSEMAESYGSYTTQQLLYMSASYLAGYSLDIPQDYAAPDNPSKDSIFTKGEYSFNDYCNMADIVVDYMDEHGKAPDSISYDGATIGYYDMVYNFALLTQDDTDASHMDFPQKSEFHRYNSNILLDILPYAIIVIAIIILIFVARTVIRRVRRRIRRWRNRDKIYDYYPNQNRSNRTNRNRQSNSHQQNRGSSFSSNSNRSKRTGRNTRTNKRNNQNNRRANNKKTKSSRIFHKNLDLDKYGEKSKNQPKRLNKRE